MKNKCEVDEGGIVCSDDAVGILVWKKTEMALAVCQKHAERVTRHRCELKRFDAGVI